MTARAAPEAPQKRHLPESEARSWAIGAHLSGLITFAGIPGPIGPLVVWLLKKDEHPLVDQHGKEALNFQISLWIYGVVAALAMVALIISIVGVLLVPLVILLFVALGLVALILPIIAAIKTSDGEPYTYPLTLRLVT